MYDSVKLEKGMYHLANQSFLDALEHADPSEQYLGTPLASLDAFERQLKRFDIHLSGEHCDKVEKFFSTTESAVLFPEFVRRAVKQGMEESILPELCAAVTKTNGTSYKGFAIDEADGAYSETVEQGESLKITALTEAETAIVLEKYGRVITASYEIVRQQRIDVFAVMLRAIGHKLAGAIAGAALAKLGTALTPLTLSGSTLAYADLAALYGEFSDYDMTTVIASPKNVAAILAMDEMADHTTDADGTIRLPFGAKLLKDSSLSDTTIIGIAKDFALECVTGSDVLLETDQLINCQLDRIAVSVRVGFQPLMEGAAASIDWT
ncbi:MAG: hypothetical protein IKL87_06105 [Oscillospiraceae bacterium]|nr:hypothetical protein [Oscillospiraceae bacterium]